MFIPQFSQHTYAQTLRTGFDNPLCKELTRATDTPPPQTKPKLPQQQREEPVYAISLATNRRDNRQPTNNVQNGTFSGKYTACVTENRTTKSYAGFIT